MANDKTTIENIQKQFNEIQSELFPNKRKKNKKMALFLTITLIIILLAIYFFIFF